MFNFVKRSALINENDNNLELSNIIYYGAKMLQNSR